MGHGKNDLGRGWRVEKARWSLGAMFMALPRENGHDSGLIDEMKVDTYESN